MPTIVVPVAGSVKTPNNLYTNSVGTQGTGISYTITTSSTTKDYWVITSVVNCTVSSNWGEDGDTITVTPTANVSGVDYWGFLTQEWQYETTPTPSSQADPDIALDGIFQSRIDSSGGFSAINGAAIVSGPFIRTTVTDPTYGLEVYNSSGNLTLDLNSVYPTIYATGTASSMAAGSTQTISVSGFNPNGSFVPIAFGPNPIDSYTLATFYSSTVNTSTGEITRIANEFKIQDTRSSGSNITPGWIVLKL